MRSLGGAPVVELVPGSGETQETQGAPLPPPPVSVSARQEGGHRSGGGGGGGPSPDRRRRPDGARPASTSGSEGHKLHLLEAPSVVGP